MCDIIIIAIAIVFGVRLLHYLLCDPHYIFHIVEVEHNKLHQSHIHIDLSPAHHVVAITVILVLAPCHNIILIVIYLNMGQCCYLIVHVQLLVGDQVAQVR